MANVFVSHRKVDATHAERLAQELRAAGHQVWFEDWEISPCDSIVQKVNQGLTGASYVVLCLSSAGDSAWVGREWMSTLARQLAGKPVKILPALLTGGTLPAILADIAYADLMTDWNRGVAALLRVIK